MKVVQFMRKPLGGGFSVERVFEDIRRVFPKTIDVEVYISPYPSIGIWRRAAGMLNAIFHQGDINHVTGDVHFLSILMRRRSTVLTVLDCVALERLSGWRYWILWFFWYWLPAKRAAIITVISHSTKMELERHLGSGDWPISVIPCPVSSEFTWSPKVFNHSCPTILQVGTADNKNLNRVASALEGICCKLVIVGELQPSQIARLNEHSVNYENYVNLSREDLVAKYHSSDIVMFASLYEGFGLPILEAQAVGRPVITSKLYSMPEVGGKGAFYVNPRSVKEIRSALRLITENSDVRERMVEAGRINVKRFSVEVIARRYLRIYRDIYLRRNGLV